MRVVVDRVSKTYRDGAGREVPALQEVSLTVEPEEFVAILGPSGCGKSTLLNIIAGLLPASAGAVHFEGDAPRGHAADGHGLPGVRALSLAHGARQRRVRARGAGRAARRAHGARAALRRHDRARRLRGQVPPPALGRHAPASRHRAGARRRSRGAPDGRAVLRARRPDAHAHDGGAARASGSARARASST